MRVCRVCILVVALLVGGCDDGSSTPSVPVMPMPVETGPAYELDLQPIAPLTPNRLTHVVVDAQGNVGWLQEGEGADDSMFMMGEGQIPRMTQLTARRVAETIGGKGATGKMHSIAAARNGEVYFYFLGGKGRTMLAALGMYSPKTDKIRILTNADGLMNASGFGKSLVLARASLYTNNDNLWLWLRHTDSSALFRLRHTDIPPAGPLNLGSSLRSVTIADEKIELTKDDYLFAPGELENLLFIDLEESELRQIDGLGRVSTLRSLIGLPVALSAPLREKDGRIILFAGDAPLMQAQHIGQVGVQTIRLNVPYPAIVMIPPGSTSTARGIGRDKFSIYSDFKLQAMRIRELVPDPRGGGWIAYDLSSGELLRMKMRQRPGIPAK